MTKEKKEQLSNRLVINFGILLLGASIMLYVRSGIMSSMPYLAYIVVLVAGFLGLAAAIVLFALGKTKKPTLENYSAVGLGVFIAAVLVYISKFTHFSFYDKSMAILTVYALMLIYFIVMAIYTAVMLRKPLVKDPAKEQKSKALKKAKKKRK